MKTALRGFRGALYSKVRGLDDVAFDLEIRTKDLTWRVDRAAAALQENETYRWYTGLGKLASAVCMTGRFLSC